MCKSRSVAHSIFFAEIIAIGSGFDLSNTLHPSLTESFGRIILLNFYTRSNSFKDSIVNINSTVAKSQPERS